MSSHGQLAVTEPETSGLPDATAERQQCRPSPDFGSPVPTSLAPLSFAELYMSSFADMVRLARVLVDSPETAEDLVQDAFVRLHRHWDGVREPRAYLHRSVVNACRSHHRRAWRERPRLGAIDRPPGGASTAPADGAGDTRPAVLDSAVQESRADDAGILVAALGVLPYRQRAAIVLRYYADLPDAEIATALGCRVGTVASLVHRGLARLREVIDHDR